MHILICFVFEAKQFATPHGVGAPFLLCYI
uniref:Uncharacterized protein n=1 Tax=Heterorhabditis bacteriophora TaxID=37862 RepID=A0A1I7XCF8_HETBA